jgi:phenylacetate-CoA ligase
VNVFPSQIENVLLEVGTVEPHYQILVDRGAARIDELEILIEAPADVCGDRAQLVQLEQRLNYEVQSALSITCKVRVVGPQEIARTEGKAVRVVDKRSL